MSRTITVAEWVKEVGTKEVGKLLELDPSTPRNWVRGWVLPDSRTMGKIRKLTKGRVSLDKSVDEHWSDKNAKNRFRG